MIGAITGRIIVQLVVRTAVTEVTRNLVRDGYETGKRLIAGK